MTIPTSHPFGFDPTHGMDLAALQSIQPPPAPAGFAAFWQARHDEAMAVRPGLQARPAAQGHADWLVEDVVFTSTGGFRIGGWLLRPRQGGVRRGLVVGHGYGGRDQPDFDIPVRDTAVLFPCFRGLSRSKAPPISDDPAWHVLHDIGTPERYIIGGCVQDLWVSVSVLEGLFPAIRGQVGYGGVSFGGGIGALGMAFDRRIDRGFLEVPTFGNMPLWTRLPSVGSAHAVHAYLQTHPEAMDTLRLFDAAVAASLIRAPMLVAPARFDPAVAPPCQFSVANALTGASHHETVVLDAGHFDYEGMRAQHDMLRAKVGRLFEAA